MTKTPLICVIDDTADYLLLVETTFNRFWPEYSLRSFANGQDFLDALPHLSVKPDLILLDQHMPQLSGYLILTSLKSQTKCRSIPVVMMSAASSHLEISSFYQAGAAAFIAKPTDFSELKEAMQVACQYASRYTES